MLVSSNIQFGIISALTCSTKGMRMTKRKNLNGCVKTNSGGRGSQGLNQIDWDSGPLVWKEGRVVTEAHTYLGAE